MPSGWLIITPEGRLRRGMGYFSDGAQVFLHPAVWNAHGIKYLAGFDISMVSIKLYRTAPRSQSELIETGGLEPLLDLGQQDRAEAFAAVGLGHGHLA